jgi:predicted nuclease with TOPRIM domain
VGDPQALFEELRERVEALERDREEDRERIETLELRNQALRDTIDKLVRRERAVAAAYNVASDSLDPWLPGPASPGERTERAEPVVKLDE